MLGVKCSVLVNPNAVTILCVSDAHNLTACPLILCDYGHREYGEIDRLKYCL